MASKAINSAAVRNDDAFALLDCSPGFFSEGYTFTPARLSPEHYFWLAAHRAIPCMQAHPWDKPENPASSVPQLPGGEQAQEYARVNHLYNQAVPHMHRPRLIEGGNGILWLDADGTPTVFWAFANTTFAWQGQAIELDGENEKSLNPAGQLNLRQGHVYRLNA